MAKKNVNISQLSEEDLLKVRICDLPLAIEGTWLKECVDQLYSELQSKGIQFKPPCYLADEWLTPDEEPVVGIPFFLADPALIKLEKKLMLEVEGGTKSWCMKLLRHETGHAINYAYKLYRKKKWQKVFGRFTQEYGDTYRFRPYSKNYVRHLEDFYAQYHPDEDFAETFAIWLTPDSNWQSQYKGWKALAKLVYVQELMKGINNKEPIVKKGARYWQASKMKTTLKNFYKKKMYSYAEEFPDFHDSNLKNIFSLGEDRSISDKNLKLAAGLLRQHKKEILNSVAKWTGEKKYIIADLVDVIIKRSKALKLIVVDDEPIALLKIMTYITTSVMNYSYTGGYRRDN
tara:strand:- start:456 stop:1490 length:1035 start_codon:yes stop_codon:yes gene_type:complete